MQDLSDEIDFCEIDDICVLDNVMYNEKFMLTQNVINQNDIKYGNIYKKFGIDNLISFKKRRKINGTKTMILKLFNIPIAKWEKF